MTRENAIMTNVPACIFPDQWLRQIFSARAAVDGGVIRRQVRDVERIIGRAVTLPPGFNPV